MGAYFFQIFEKISYCPPPLKGEQAFLREGHAPSLIKASGSFLKTIVFSENETIVLKTIEKRNKKQSFNDRF